MECSNTKGAEMKENDRLEKLCKKIINGELILQWYGGMCGVGSYVLYEARLPKVFSDQPDIKIECFTESRYDYNWIVVQLLVSQDVVAEIKTSYSAYLDIRKPDTIKDMKRYNGSEVPGLLLAEVIKQNDLATEERKAKRKKITDDVIDKLLE